VKVIGTAKNATNTTTLRETNVINAKHQRAERAAIGSVQNVTSTTLQADQNVRNAKNKSQKNSSKWKKRNLTDKITTINRSTMATKERIGSVQSAVLTILPQEKNVTNAKQANLRNQTPKVQTMNINKNKKAKNPDLIRMKMASKKGTGIAKVVDFTIFPKELLVISAINLNENNISE